MSIKLTAGSKIVSISQASCSLVEPITQKNNVVFFKTLNFLWTFLFPFSNVCL